MLGRQAAGSGSKDPQGSSENIIFLAARSRAFTKFLANGSQDAGHYTLLLASIPLHQDRLAFRGARHRVQASQLGSRKLWPGASGLQAIMRGAPW